ncbi:ABC transporter ATP-binding protein [Mycoplasma sp. Ms02]|uniref:ABC transporter ATP-binding protein n=1 Tax=Mycoplasma sp. Ms02 TaxID=353851 RepID=UPI001C89783A|nr:ABC transporter ATP-binding protein [Mycoplasma sp. Ms02]QZE12463.1 ABC transporter ATP-binding protein/permease [Mycoplasma sp. Ms02]
MKKTVKSKNFSFSESIFVLKSFLLKQKLQMNLGITFAFFNALTYVIGSFYIGYIFRTYFSAFADGKASYESFNSTQFAIDLTILAVMFISYGIFKYLQSYCFIKASFRSSGQMSRALMDKLFKANVTYYDKNQAGDIISTLVNDVTNVSTTMYAFLNSIFANLFNVLLSTVTLFLASIKLSLIFVPVTLVMMMLSYFALKRAQPLFIAVREGFGEMNGFLEEAIANTRITNAFNQTKQMQNKFDNIVDGIRHNSFKGDLYSRSVDPWFMVVIYTAQVMITVIVTYFFFNNVTLWGVSGFGADSNDHADSGFIITYTALCWNYLGPFNALLRLNFSFQNGVASIVRVSKILKIETEKTTNEKVHLENLEGHIEFKNVYFKYNKESLEYQLKNASFEAKPGEQIAIVGPTGAGKTTIISLLSKFYEYDKGQILVDGIELKNIDKQNFRALTSVVLQDSFLFKDTIRNNLKLYNTNISDQQVEDAAKLTNAHHFIMALENGYETVIDETFVLSQGQKQILSITRAILSNQKLLILDEATSNVDSNTEQVIQKALMELMKNKTTFVIAHRLSTIKNADKIIVVNNGFIVEIGNHNELISKKGFYYDLYNASLNSNK